MTKETGIIMSLDHPQLIRQGLKTMTRRTYGLEKINRNPDYWIKATPVSHTDKWRFESQDGELLIVKCPYGHIGDLLWVKEAFSINDRGQIMTRSEKELVSAMLDIPDIKIKWTSPYFMKKADCNLWLEITGLRPERLQDITEEDALAEGIKVMQGTWQSIEKDENTGELKLVGEPQPYTARYHYGALWDNLNLGRGYGWKFNPWVWVPSFKLLKEKDG